MIETGAMPVLVREDFGELFGVPDRADLGFQVSLRTTLGDHAAILVHEFQGGGL